MVSILTPNLVRTPDLHRDNRPQELNPDPKPSKRPNLQVARLQTTVYYQSQDMKELSFITALPVSF